MSPICWFRYALHRDVERFIALGWCVVAELGPTHGAYAVLMQWAGEGEPC